MATGAPVAVLSFNANGTTLAIAVNGASEGGSTELWSSLTQEQTGAALAAPGSGRVSALAFGPGAGLLATGDGNGTITLWNPAGFHQSSAPVEVGTPGSLAAAGGHPAGVLSARGDVLAVSGARRTVRFRNALTGRPIGRPVATRHAVTGLALSPDGKTLAVSAGGLRLWSTATGQRVGAPLPAADAAGPVAFSPDGRLVAAIGSDGRARLWNAATRQETGTTVAVGPGQETLALSRDGTMLATAAGDSVRLWDVATRQEIGAPMTAGTGRVYAIAFSPDGTMLATAGGDGTARLWDVAAQQEIGTPMTASQAPVYAVAFSPDGATLTTAGGDGTARAWDVAFPAGLPTAACAIAGQSLTRQQWAGYAGTQPFQQVCPAS